MRSTVQASMVKRGLGARRCRGAYQGMDLLLAERCEQDPGKQQLHAVVWHGPTGVHGCRHADRSWCGPKGPGAEVPPCPTQTHRAAAARSSFHPSIL